MKTWFKFFYAAAAVLLTAYICSVLTQTGIRGWYHAFPRPRLTPPDIVFPIAWSVIYALLIISTFIVLRDAKDALRDRANNLFILQLVLQILWCAAFFVEGYLGLGLAVIILLDIAVFKMIMTFGRINRLAAWLVYPYYWWLLFATFLNASFVYVGGLVIVF